MFERTQKSSGTGLAFGMLELIYHSVVRNIRKTHGNAIIGLLQDMSQAALFVGAFYIMFSVLGLRGSAIRGDFLVFLMSGIFLFLTHIKTMGAVLGSEGPTSAMMKHAPMNTVISIIAAAIGALYTQTLSMFVILFIYYVAVTPFEVDDPVGVFSMYLASWFSGVGVGMVFLAMKPWMPGFVKIVSSVYSRANMIASGKMVVANTLPGFMLAMFNWNPLFHSIDQARDAAFINYNTDVSSPTYPVYVALALIMIGLMGEFYTRKNASASWYAKR